MPATAQHPIALRTSALAGEYELIQVQSQPAGGTVIRSRLHLVPLDSSAKAASAGGAVRDLVGWREPAEGDSAVVLAGQRLRLGSASSGELVQNLEITAVAPEGFWGWWKADRGLALTETQTRRVAPDPAGYFCALRRGS